MNCKCGCGNKVTWNRDFRRGHNLRLVNPMDNPESVKKVALNRGVKKCQNVNTFPNVNYMQQIV